MLTSRARPTYHLDIIVIKRGAMATLAVVMILDQVLIDLLFARPCLITKRAIVSPMVARVHVLGYCATTPKVS